MVPYDTDNGLFTTKNMSQVNKTNKTNCLIKWMKQLLQLFPVFLLASIIGGRGDPGIRVVNENDASYFNYIYVRVFGPFDWALNFILLHKYKTNSIFIK